MNATLSWKLRSSTIFRGYLTESNGMKRNNSDDLDQKKEFCQKSGKNPKNLEKAKIYATSGRYYHGTVKHL